jgi:hypothetical protein
VGFYLIMNIFVMDIEEINHPLTSMACAEYGTSMKILKKYIYKVRLQSSRTLCHVIWEVGTATFPIPSF